MGAFGSWFAQLGDEFQSCSGIFFYDADDQTADLQDPGLPADSEGGRRTDCLEAGLLHFGVDRDDDDPVSVAELRKQEAEGVRTVLEDWRGKALCKVIWKDMAYMHERQTEQDAIRLTRQWFGSLREDAFIVPVAAPDPTFSAGMLAYTNEGATCICCEDED